MLIDILPEIFEKLSVKDLLRCRQVCRAWRYVIERLFLKELCVYVRMTYVLDVWHIDNELVDERNALTVNHLSVLSDRNFLNTFRNLKRLFIRTSDFWPFLLEGPKRSAQETEAEHLNQLNHFHQLEHLELHGVLVNKSFELKLSGLKKMFCFAPDYRPEKMFPQNLEVLGIDNLCNLNTPDHLKVLIAKKYTSEILRLVNLERLHLDRLNIDRIPPDEKPLVFVARFPKLLLLDIHYIQNERHMNEILQELITLKPTRSIQFYHRGFEVSNEKFKNSEMKLAVHTDTVSPYIDLKKLLSIASENPGMMRPFFYFRDTFRYFGDYDVSFTKPIPFEVLKSFTNVHQMSIWNFENYEELRNLLMNNRQILHFSIIVYGELENQFFADFLPKILRNLVSLRIYSWHVFESLEFLEGFGKLLAFAARFRRNEKNRQIIESIEKRRKNIAYPLGMHRYCDLSDDKLICYNDLIP